MTASFEDRFNSFAKAQNPEIKQSQPQKQSSFEERFKSFSQQKTEEPKEKERAVFSLSDGEEFVIPDVLQLLFCLPQNNYTLLFYAMQGKQEKIFAIYYVSGIIKEATASGENDRVSVMFDRVKWLNC
mgnify:CR=1 FL=1